MEGRQQECSHLQSQFRNRCRRRLVVDNQIDHGLMIDWSVHAHLALVVFQVSIHEMVWMEPKRLEQNYSIEGNLWETLRYLDSS